MRSPAIVFSLFAVTALSPSVTYGSPLPPQHTNGVSFGDHHRASSAVAPRGLGFLNEVFARADSTRPAHPTYTSKPKVASIAGVDFGPREFWKKSSVKPDSEGSSGPSSPLQKNAIAKRLDDGQTTGGNAHTGSSGAVDGGSVDSGDNGGMPTIMNLNSNNAGVGGGSTTGCADAGKGATGGNASSGNSGTAYGGSVRGSGGMMNIDSNNAGSAGESSSGCATAGNSAGVDTADGGSVDN